MRRAHLIDLSLLLLLAAPLVAAEPSKFTLPSAGGAADPLTVIGPASVCADNQVARWNGASATSLQCSVLTVDDTTGNLTAPGALTISTAASNGDITLDPHGTGDVITAVGADIQLYGLGSGATDIERLDIKAEAGTGFQIATTTDGTGSDNLRIYLKTSGTGIVYTDSNGYAAGDRSLLGNYGVVLASNADACWSSGFSAVRGNCDSGFRRAGVGVVTVNNGQGTDIGKLLTAVLVEPNTAGVASPNVLAATESATVLTNEGATALNYHTLPTAAAGLQFTFIVQDGDGIQVVAGAGDTIRLAGSASAAAGYIKSTVIGSTVTLVAINSVEWVATAINGTWSIDS